MRSSVRLSGADVPFLAVLLAGAGLRLTHVDSGRSAVLHLAGLVIGAGAYVVLLRWGVWRWLAALAVVPALLDQQVVGVESAAGRAAVLGCVLAAALVATCWRDLGTRVTTSALVGTVLVLVVLDLTAGRPALEGSPVGPVDVPSYAVLVGLALSALAVGGLGRAAGSALRRPVLLLAGLPLVVVADGSGVIGWAAVAPAVTWWPVAGALGLTALLRGRRGASATRPQADEVDEAALAGFRETYGRPRFAPVVVVIAAYNEADGIAGVLSALPAEVCGLATDVVVVDDGSADGTTAAVPPGSAYVVSCPENRGQGAALRLGYRVAREHGAAYVVTTDADGQYDVGDLPAVLEPLLQDRADFVTGSRILGRQHTHDRIRRLGVHVFAWTASALTGRRLTDTSFGMRAMRADVPAALTLNQPQYQSSELLIGAISHGYRVVEVPGTMHVRSAGSTKKGRNLVYGARYARVVLGTWWREGCPRPVRDVPALRGAPADADR